jgi:hypothetical protein
MDPYHKSIKDIIKSVKTETISCSAAFKKLKDLPYSNLGFAKLDTHRALRKGFPEVIYAQGKALAHLEKITGHCLKNGLPLLITKADEAAWQHIKARYPELKYNSVARIIYFQKKKVVHKKGFVSVVTAGTSDIPVAEEAAITLEVMGNKVRRIYDVGVAGIHRVLDKRAVLNKSRAVIVVAGMEGALASVVAGLVNKPVIAVPTSVGYGASFKGIAPLLTMLNCCAPGTAVVNIDNGFGAAYFAGMIK